MINFIKVDVCDKKGQKRDHYIYINPSHIVAINPLSPTSYFSKIILSNGEEIFTDRWREIEIDHYQKAHAYSPTYEKPYSDQNFWDD